MAYDNNEYMMETLEIEKKRNRETLETLQDMAREMGRITQDMNAPQPRVTGLTVRFSEQGAYITTTVKSSRFISAR